jgi:hypothetical protein
LGLARRLLALSVSIAVVLSSYAFTIAIASPQPAPNPSTRNLTQADSAANELQLTSASATATKTGVLLRWSTNSVKDNLGFNVYRLKNGIRTRANKEIIPGALFGPGTPAMMPGGYSYGWFDRGGSAESTYFIESVSLNGGAKMHSAITAVVSNAVSEFDQTPQSLTGANPLSPDTEDTFENRFPAAEGLQPNFGSNPLEAQWAIAAQTALKISINKDGWYRVTQPQMVAAGFNPSVDIRNLQLFVDANEVAINSSQQTGQFGSSDYIEFYGRGLDTPTSDRHIYYLIAGTTPGKRVAGDIQVDDDPDLPPNPVPSPPTPQPSPPPAQPSPPVSTTPAATSPSTRPVLRDPIFGSSIEDFSLVSWITGSSDDNRSSKQTETSKTVNSDPLSFNLRPDPAVDYFEVRSDSSGGDHASGADHDREFSKTGTAPGAAKSVDASANNSTTSARPAVSTAAAAPNLATPSPQPIVKSASRKRGRNRKRARRTVKRQLKQEYSHAMLAAAQLPNYDYTVQIKERLIYFSNLLNGDSDNFFGRVISSSVTQTLNLSNPDLTAAGTATLEFALQGAINSSASSHDVSVSFNGNMLGTVSFGPLEHPVRTFAVPIAQLQSGNNSLTFTRTSVGPPDVSLVDYIKLTYPHKFVADANSLKFNLRGSQTLQVDGFVSSSVRLIDYTDPLNVSLRRAASEPSASGFKITVPRSETLAKAQRLMYALPQGQFDQPVALSLSQPSSLNLGVVSPTLTSGADFLIIAHKNFIPSLAPLVNQRLAQGKIAGIVDVDDVYDEFSYGFHGPQAIKDFISYTLTSTNWVTKPHYIIFAGDATLDPRNYQGQGELDFVPTKLVDATYNETSSDDWLADTTGDPGGGPDGIADVCIGRLPFANVTEANLIVSKIVNFTPQPVPQSAMLIADDDQSNIYGFAQTNDVFQSLLPGSMGVQRLNRAPQPPGVPSQAVVKADIVNGFNSGPALVNYSGHGNINVWSGASIFLSEDALALTNGSHLPFVVVMDCLNGYFQDAGILSLSEAWLRAPNGGAVAAFASSGLTIAQGQHDMGHELYTQLYSGAPMPLGDAIKLAKASTFDIDVKRTWIFFGDPSLKIR